MAKSMSILIAQLAYGFLHFIFIFLQKSHWPNELPITILYSNDYFTNWLFFSFLEHNINFVLQMQVRILIVDQM